MRSFLNEAYIQQIFIAFHNHLEFIEESIYEIAIKSMKIYIARQMFKKLKYNLS